MEYRTVTTLQAKRDEILSAIAAYERHLDQARSDLASINAIIRVFEATGDPKNVSRYLELRRLFRRNELRKHCMAALEGGATLSTKEIAVYVMAVKGFDVRDTVLRIGITQRAVQQLSREAIRGNVLMLSKRNGMCVWRLPRSE
jgi:hypothetical protein